MEKRAGSERMGALFVVLSAVLFGCMPLLAKIAYAHGCNSHTVAFGRFAFGTVATALIIALSPGMTFHVTGPVFKRLLMLSVFYAVTPLLLFGSYQRIGSGLATTLHFSYPVIVMLLGVLLFGTKLEGRQLVCLAICAAGVLSLYRPEAGGEAAGMVMAVLSGLTYALYILLMGKYGPKELPVMTITFWISLLAGAEIGVYSAVTGQLILPSAWQAWTAIAVLGVFVAALALALFQAGLFRCGEIRASLLSTFEPLTGVIVGILVFRESMTLRIGVGMALILFSAVLLVVGPSRDKDSRPTILDKGTEKR